MLRVGVLTISDRSARGERDDKSGPVIQEILDRQGMRVERYEVVPDDTDMIVLMLREMTDQMELDVVLTTGGTGLSPRDVTPDATRRVIEREVPGLAELMRIESFKKTPMAALSRAVAGTRGKSLIINLPGSPRAARECVEAVLPVMSHGVAILQGQSGGH